MKKLFYLLGIVVFIVSCSQNHQETIKNIRQLEWKRSKNSTDFEKYILDENPLIRLTVADALAKIGSSVHLKPITQLLTDTENVVVEKAIFALGQFCNQDTLLLRMLDNPDYIRFKIPVIKALGRSKSDQVLQTLFNRLPDLADSLKVCTIKSLSHIAPEKIRNRNQIKILAGYLFSTNQDVRGASAYFFSRHPSARAIHSLIRSNHSLQSIQDKYRLKALSRSLSHYYIQRGDSATIDTMQTRILDDLKNGIGTWQHQLYEIDILSNIGDQVSLYTIEKYLDHENPHLRKAAINALSRSDSISIKQILLRRYQDASWADKGNIILSLSKKDPEMAYSFIQQNLDKGTIYFKQLLLKSLAKIRGRLSRRTLRQFLQVPNPRLNYTAFQELWDMRYIGYKHTYQFLLSGDMALTSIAAEWVTEHPEWAKFDDLTEAYNKFREPADVETMMAILSAISLIKSPESNQFLKNIHDSTSSYVLAKEANEGLAKAAVPVPLRTDLQPELFIPDTIYIQNEPIDAIIETEKGDILIELLPEAAPVTVSNFIHLASNAYYNNLTFHRVISDFVVQGGDPRGDGWGGPGYSIPCEYNDLPFERGTIGMATAGKDTGGSQFFICHSEQPHLNRRYTVFAKVINGMDVVDKIEINDKINKIVIQK